MRQPFASLYLHVPFCRGKCGYCVFYSLPAATAAQRAAYLPRMEREFAEFAGRCGDLQSVFLGGGTPSVLEPAEITGLLRAVQSHFRLTPDCEITTEANPESLTSERIAALAGGGVNRVSLGVQSFQSVHRATLQRCGSLAPLPALLATLGRCGIRNFGADLIYAIPGQTLADWRADVRQACELGITHLSTYALTLEEGSRLTAAGVRPCDDDLAVDMWHATAEEGAPFGLQRYEVSNLARPGHECRHNLEIWYGRTYLGCGPAASSYDGALRWTNPADFDAWLQAPMRRSEDPLPPPARAAEVFAFGLRTVAGWDWAQFRERTGFDAREFCAAALCELRQDNLLEDTPAGIRPTNPRGLLFADRIAARILA